MHPHHGTRSRGQHFNISRGYNGLKHRAAKSTAVSQMPSSTSEPIYSVQTTLGVSTIPVATNRSREDCPRFIESSQCTILTGPTFLCAAAIRLREHYRTKNETHNCHRWSLETASPNDLHTHHTHHTHLQGAEDGLSNNATFLSKTGRCTIKWRFYSTWFRWAGSWEAAMPP